MVMTNDPDAAGSELSAIALQFLSVRDEIIAHWEREVRTHVKRAKNLPHPILIDTLPQFLVQLARALTPAYARDNATSGTNAAAMHGGERARMTAYGPEQLLHEYQLLRDAIAAVTRDRVALGEEEWRIIERSFDAAMREALRTFTHHHEELRHKVAAALTHDMRTPLGVISTGAALIVATGDLELARRMASRIQSNAGRLAGMMEELLDALTYHGGAKVPLQLSYFDMLDLVEELRGQYAQILDPGAVLQVSGQPVAGHWCRNAMRRALENLINNAAKYGGGGRIGVSLSSAHERLVLSVHNEGNPIPVEQQDRIFEYLCREGGMPMTTGWGIGLPYVKAVAEGHGGSVSVESSAETGTTFVIDLPLDCRPYVEPEAVP